MELHGHADDLFHRGIALKDKGQREAAAALFRKVLAIEPRHTRAEQELRRTPCPGSFGSRA